MCVYGVTLKLWLQVHIQTFHHDFRSLTLTLLPITPHPPPPIPHSPPSFAAPPNPTRPPRQHHHLSQEEEEEEEVEEGWDLDWALYQRTAAIDCTLSSPWPMRKVTSSLSYVLYVLDLGSLISYSFVSTRAWHPSIILSVRTVVLTI